MGGGLSIRVPLVPQSGGVEVPRECCRFSCVTTIMNSLSRFKTLQSRIAPFSRSFSGTSTVMAGLDINSKLRMLSGYEIPVLGYGVRIKASCITVAVSALASLCEKDVSYLDMR